MLYGDENVAGGEYVWCHEWNAAVERRRLEREQGVLSPYRVSPLFVAPVTPARLTEFAISHGQDPQEIVNGERIASNDDLEHDRVARLLLAAAVNESSRGRSGRAGRPLRIFLTTFQAPAEPDADILVDWRTEVDSPLVDWSQLIAARNDLRDVLIEVQWRSEA